MVTMVPPDSGPRLGLRKLTAGVCRKERTSSVLLLSRELLWDLGQWRRTSLSAQGQLGQGWEQPGLVEGVPNKALGFWGSLPTQTNL